MGLRNTDRRNSSHARRLGPSRESALHWSLQHVGVAIRKNALNKRPPWSREVREHAQPLQPMLPGRGTRDECSLQRGGYSTPTLESSRERILVGQIQTWAKFRCSAVQVRRTSRHTFLST